MVLRLNMADSSFEKSFSEYASKSRESGADVRPDVAAIIDKVRSEGFGALAELTEKYDGHSISKETARVSLESCREAFKSLDKDLQGALRHSADRIRVFHERQIPDDFREVDSVGIEAGWRWTPVDAAGLYAPGGRAAYPSSVLMNAIPAKVAGVERLVLVTPTPGGTVNQTVLAAAYVAGVDEVWVVGGAQAIAALAFGADPIEPVDVIVGPGNAFVAEAKRQVFGHVGVDSVAGPSEVVVIADADNDPDWIAADLLSQAEHDPSSQAVLFTPDKELADAVAAAATKQLEDHPRRDITTAAWQNNSAIVVTQSLTAAASLSNRLAPEHLEIATEHPEEVFAEIKHAGAVFLGKHAPEALGDYLAGPNHVLPTSGAARYASGLSTLNFMKRTTIVRAGPDAIKKVGEDVIKLADAEGLPGHARSISFRLGQ